MSHIAVIGAGITGITTAHALIERGHHVMSGRRPAIKGNF